MSLMLLLRNPDRDKSILLLIPLLLLHLRLEEGWVCSTGIAILTHFSLTRGPSSCACVCVRLSGACSIVNKMVLHFPFKYVCFFGGFFLHMISWSGSPEGRKEKWEDSGTKISPDTLWIPMASLNSSFATIQVLRIIKLQGRQKRDVKWEQDQT